MGQSFICENIFDIEYNIYFIYFNKLLSCMCLNTIGLIKQNSLVLVVLISSDYWGDFKAHIFLSQNT